MSREFKLPDLGEGVHEGEIVEVPVSVGDEVKEDDIILTVETDKAAVDIPSPYSGKIQEIHVEKDQIVHVGDVMLTFSNGEGEAQAAEDQETEEAKAEEKKAEKEKAKAEDQEVEDQEAEAEEEKKEKQEKEKQPQAEAEERKEKERAEAPPREGRPVPASPNTRRIARELDVDLHQVEGSGPGGRVTENDVRAFAEEGTPKREAKEKAPETEEPKKREEREEREEREGRRAPALETAAPELPDFSKWGEVERVPLRSVRRVTARRMSQSWSQIPHVAHHDKADVTELENLRQQYQAEMGLENLTLTAFVMKAVVAALKKYPRFNASLDPQAGEIVIKHYYNIGLAVDTERGLIVPVITDVDSKSLTDLSGEMAELVKRTRAGETGLEEMQGGTFTITNVGPIGGTHFDPIINFPQAAILGMARVDWEPVVVSNDDDRRIEPRYMLPLVLGFDHRIADGAEAARFVNDVVTMLEDPDRFMLRL